ncbi:extracellular serine-threonine rich protein [Aaosphaeria arxii CBS 175.79]|uniref:Extracellular serine-threonine rich protein n=1 Tax=Aaosphaeria arxii CBS 175.79 TaxID=1450172 RepID=A0A6A5XLJ1_9PLEO|nr:extracellular serine-threonine rich protein [Aaosphaeria arxii CBS 175.79]KAF2014022.1 extracellular serine-threonine rich protein [Aaosphaeria arxii CBS 175.79]
MFAKSIIVSLLAAFAVAQVHPPVGEPSGNPIAKPSLNERVPKGVEYTITWAPTTTNTVSLLLVKGPSNNVVPIATLVERLPNNGAFKWTPSTSLETTGDRFYGIQLIDDVTGQYQWSTQFGLTGETTGPTASVSASVTGGGASTKEGYPTGTPSLSHYPTELSSSVKSSTVGYPTSTPSAYPTKSVGTVSSGYPVHNSTIVQPTKTPTVPATLKTSNLPTNSPSATTSEPAESTGGASGIKAGLSFAGVMAVAAAFL